MIIRIHNNMLRILAALLLLLNSGVAPAEIIATTIEHPRFGQLNLYRPSAAPKGVVLFLSDAGGWNAELTTAAQSIADLSYSVVGINLPSYLAHLGAEHCVDIAAALNELHQFIVQRQALTHNRPPIILGYGVGATLSYAALVQAAADMWHAGIAVNFCPELPLSKPLCPGVGKLESVADQQLQRLHPAPRLATTWFVFANHSPCPNAANFVQGIPLARWTVLPGEAALQTWLPSVTALLQWLDPSIAQQAHPAAGVNNVLLIEVPATISPQRPQLALLISGDGGWAKLDRSLSATLAKHGVSTVGWDALSYFWKARQVDGVALDLERVLRHYLSAWHKERLLLIGYSFGADVLPALITRLPVDLRQRIDLAVFLGLSEYASFAFHLTDWISDSRREGDLPVRPELEKIRDIKSLCIYGTDEEQSACPNAAQLGVNVIPMPGDHHFDEDYPGVARRILEQLPPLR